jgi:hypothetical protein
VSVYFLLIYRTLKLISFRRNRRLTFVITACAKGILTSHNLLSLLALCQRGKVFPSYEPAIVENEQEAELPENQANIALSGQNSMLINGSATLHAGCVFGPTVNICIYGVA